METIHYIDHVNPESPDCANTACGLGFDYKRYYEKGSMYMDDVTCKRCIRWLLSKYSNVLKQEYIQKLKDKLNK